MTVVSKTQYRVYIQNFKKAIRSEYNSGGNILKRRGNYSRKRYTVSKSLSEFIRDEMNKRKMTARQFAEFLEVAPSTVTTYLRGQETEPTLAFLRKLAKQTDTPLATVIAVAFPDVAGEIGDVSPHILLLATRLSNLPESVLNIIKRIIDGEK
jgi:transcriptional regulator with XRE-family HTH domain